MTAARRIYAILRTADVVEWALMFLVALWLPMFLVIWEIFG